MDGGPLHVLIAARGYPAADNPVRGIFVADQAAALRAMGMDVAVASWESAVLVQAGGGTASGATGTPGAWVDIAATRTEPVCPRSWGAPDVPVARLPTVVELDGSGASDPVVLAERQADTLVPFGRRLADRWPIDIVHAHTGLPDGVAAARLADRLGVPLVVTEHESTLATRLATERGRAAYRSLMGPGRRLIAVSATLRGRIVDLLGVPADRIDVIPNPIDLTAFDLAGPTDRDLDELLWVGSRSAAKGTDRLLAAFALLRAERPSLHLRLVGWAATEAEETRLRSLAGQLGIADAVAFEPRADRAGVAGAMARAAVFVHPSSAETFGVVVAEALASGLPVAATPSGGVDEIVGAGGACGTIAASTEPAALAAAVRAVLDRRAAFDPARLRGHVEERFAAPAVAARLLHLYGELRATASGPASGASARSGRPTIASLLPVPSARRPLIVAMRRGPALSRIGHLPAGLAAGLVVVTSAGPSGSPQPGPAWIEVDPDRGLRDARRRLGGPLPDRPLARLAGVIRHPMRAMRLRHLTRRRAELALETQRAAIRDALAGMAREADGTLEILPLDVADLDLVAPVLDARLRLFPTTLRGLADRWDAAGRSPVATAPGRAEPVGAGATP